MKLIILLLFFLVTESFAQRIEVIKPSGTKSIVTMSGGATIDDTGNVTLNVPAATDIVSTIVLNVDGAGTVLTTGVKGYIQLPWNCTITGWTLLSKETGSVVIDVWRDTYAAYPPTVLDTITAGAKPTLSSASKNTSSSLTGWLVAGNAGDVIGFNIDSVTTITKLTLTLTVTHQ